jgi:hypothetical protein
LKDGKPLNAVETADAPQVDAIYLNMVEKGPAKEINEFESGRKVSIGVDTCAGVTVWPEHLCSEYPTAPTPESISGYTYSSAGAGSEPIRDLGQRVYALNVDGSQRNLKVRVAKVRRPLMAVSEMTAAGHDVHFLANGTAFAKHTQTGKKTEFHLRRGIYEMDAVVLPKTK